MYNIYAIVILILFDIPRISVNDLHQIQVAAPSPSSRKLCWPRYAIISTHSELGVVFALTISCDFTFTLHIRGVLFRVGSTETLLLTHVAHVAGAATVWLTL